MFFLMLLSLLCMRPWPQKKAKIIMFHATKSDRENRCPQFLWRASCRRRRTMLMTTTMMGWVSSLESVIANNQILLSCFLLVHRLRLGLTPCHLSLCLSHLSALSAHGSILRTFFPRLWPFLLPSPAVFCLSNNIQTRLLS